MLDNTFYSKDLHNFASQIIWYMKPKAIIEDKDLFLLHIMSMQSDNAYKHAKKYFNYTDEDFKNALYNAQSGIIYMQEIWNLWNERLNIHPYLPMPQKKWLHEMSEEEVLQKYCK